MPLEDCHALWIGPHLGELAAACLRSFVRAGHRVILHTYEELPDAHRAGVEVADASKVLPRERVFRHVRTGSYAMFSNLFRYEILRRSMGLYIDCDVVCIRPMVRRDGYVFGYQNSEQINGAILKIPADSRLLRDLLQLFDVRVFAPPWWTMGHRARQYVKALIGMPTDPANAPWGSAGPAAITYYAEKHGVARLAAQREVFYPLPCAEAQRVLDPRFDPVTVISPETLCFHLWHEALRSGDLSDPPPGSLLQRLYADEWPSFGAGAPRTEQTDA